MKQQPNIAIDGPAGAGKSTVAKEIAARLGLLYIDTGAMYRAITLKALNRHIPLDDEAALTQLAKETDILLKNRENGCLYVQMDGEDVTEAIRSPEVSRLVSWPAKVAGVRAEMVRKQREIAAGGGVVMDGRDIGTHVLPDAEFKFFLTATPEERARRRAAEFRRKGLAVNLDELSADLRRRDEIDSTRAVAPLRQAPDAILIDTTGKEIPTVVEEILRHVQREL